jgi:hypothetical protein
MRRLVLRQRYFTDISSIAVVTLALFQRSVIDLKKCGKQIKRKQLAIQHTPAILFVSQLGPFRLRIWPRMRTTAKQEGWKIQRKY